jgi:hypothetical protein
LSKRIAVITVFCLLALGCSSTVVTTDRARGVELVNFTGSTLRAVYLSPTDSSAWQENVLGTEQLNDGASITVNFNSEEKQTRWDIKIEGNDGHFAEWKDLDLRDAAKITLSLKLVTEPTVVADIELRKN